MSFVMSFVATAMGTDHDAGPEDHREDEDDAGDNHDDRRERKEPVPWPVLPRRRCCRLGLRPS